MFNLLRQINKNLFLGRRKWEELQVTFMNNKKKKKKKNYIQFQYGALGWEGKGWGRMAGGGAKSFLVGT